MVATSSSSAQWTRGKQLELPPRVLLPEAFHSRTTVPQTPRHSPHTSSCANAALVRRSLFLSSSAVLVQPCCPEKITQASVLDKELVIPFVQLKQVPTVQPIQETLENPQVQLLDTFVDMVVVVQRQVLFFSKSSESHCNCRSCRSSTRWLTSPN